MLARAKYECSAHIYTSTHTSVNGVLAVKVLHPSRNVLSKRPALRPRDGICRVEQTAQGALDHQLCDEERMTTAVDSGAVENQNVRVAERPHESHLRKKLEHVTVE